MDDGHLNDSQLEVGVQARARLIVPGALFLLVAVLAGIDLVADMKDGARPAHWGVELVVFVAGLIGLLTMLRALLRLSARTRALRDEAAALGKRLNAETERSRSAKAALDETQAEAARWRRRADAFIWGLGSAIEEQFNRWSLSASEKEVAMLMLKGMSHKEIADLRCTTEATTRQQARQIYKKAGLSSRRDLSAFFLEDLLLPSQRRARDEDRHPSSAAPSRQ